MRRTILIAFLVLCGCNDEEKVRTLAGCRVKAVDGVGPMPPPCMKDEHHPDYSACVKSSARLLSVPFTAALLIWPTPEMLAQQSEAEFRGVTLGAPFQKPPSGFEYGGQVVAGVGVRADSYIRTYEEGGTVTVNLIGVYGGRIISKQQSTLVPNKTACAEGIVLMVEGLSSAGVTGWQKTWREDYQVPVYKTDVPTNAGIVLAKVTCRMVEGRHWFLEYVQGLRWSSR